MGTETKPFNVADEAHEAMRTVPGAEDVLYVDVQKYAQNPSDPEALIGNAKSLKNAESLGGLLKSFSEERVADGSSTAKIAENGQKIIFVNSKGETNPVLTANKAARPNWDHDAAAAWAFDHELAHITLPDGMSPDSNGRNYTENLADGYAAARSVQRNPASTIATDVMAARAFIATQDPIHGQEGYMTTETIERTVDSMRRNDMYKHMTPQETIELAEQKAYDHTPLSVDVAHFNKVYSNLPPGNEKYFAIAEKSIATKDAYSAYVGQKASEAYLETQVNDPQNGARARDLLKRMDTHAEKLKISEPAFSNRNANIIDVQGVDTTPPVSPGGHSTNAEHSTHNPAHSRHGAHATGETHAQPPGEERAGAAHHTAHGTKGNDGDAIFSIPTPPVSGPGGPAPGGATAPATAAPPEPNSGVAIVDAMADTAPPSRTSAAAQPPEVRVAPAEPAAPAFRGNSNPTLVSAGNERDTALAAIEPIPASAPASVPPSRPDGKVPASGPVDVMADTVPPPQASEPAHPARNNNPTLRSAGNERDTALAAIEPIPASEPAPRSSASAPVTLDVPSNGAPTAPVPTAHPAPVTVDVPTNGAPTAPVPTMQPAPATKPAPAAGQPLFETPIRSDEIHFSSDTAPPSSSNPTLKSPGIPSTGTPSGPPVTTPVPTSAAPTAPVPSVEPAPVTPAVPTSAVPTPPVPTVEPAPVTAPVSSSSAPTAPRAPADVGSTTMVSPVAHAPAEHAPVSGDTTIHTARRPDWRPTQPPGPPDTAAPTPRNVDSAALTQPPPIDSQPLRSSEILPASRPIDSEPLRSSEILPGTPKSTSAPPASAPAASEPPASRFTGDSRPTMVSPEAHPTPAPAAPNPVEGSKFTSGAKPTGATPEAPTSRGMNAGFGATVGGGVASALNLHSDVHEVGQSIKSGNGLRTTAAVLSLGSDVASTSAGTGAVINQVMPKLAPAVADGLEAAGRYVLPLAVVGALARVAEANDKKEAFVKESSGLVGGMAMGEAGAALGTVGGPIGVAVGAVGGGILGAMGGQQVAMGIYHDAQWRKDEEGYLAQERKKLIGAGLPGTIAVNGQPVPVELAMRSPEVRQAVLHELDDRQSKITDMYVKNPQSAYAAGMSGSGQFALQAFADAKGAINGFQNSDLEKKRQAAARDEKVINSAQTGEALPPRIASDDAEHRQKDILFESKTGGELPQTVKLENGKEVPFQTALCDPTFNMHFRQGLQQQADDGKISKENAAALIDRVNKFNAIEQRRDPEEQGQRVKEADEARRAAPPPIAQPNGRFGGPPKPAAKAPEGYQLVDEGRRLTPEEISQRDAKTSGGGFSKLRSADGHNNDTQIPSGDSALPSGQPVEALSGTAPAGVNVAFSAAAAKSSTPTPIARGGGRGSTHASSPAA